MNIREYPCDYGTCPYDAGYAESCRYNCGIGEPDYDAIQQTTIDEMEAERDDLLSAEEV